MTSKCWNGDECEGKAIHVHPHDVIWEMASLVPLEKSYVICPYWELNHVSLDIQLVTKPHTNYTSQQL